MSELFYLRAVMEWLERGGKYEPLDFERIYQDWQQNISRGKPSALPPPHGNWDFEIPPQETPGHDTIRS